MIRLTDGKFIIQVEMIEFQNGVEFPDYSADFLMWGLLIYDEDNEAYVVRDLDYCIDQMLDWEIGIGDYEYPRMSSTRIERFTSSDYVGDCE